MRKLIRIKKYVKTKRKPVDPNSLDELEQKKFGVQLRRLKALEMRREGKSYSSIAKKLNSTIRIIHMDIGTVLKKEIQKRTRTHLAQIVQLELERLDLLFEKAWELIKGNNVAAIDKALKIMERRAKYLGLDAPAKSILGEDQENPFRGDGMKMKAILVGMIKNREKIIDVKNNKEIEDDIKND